MDNEKVQANPKPSTGKIRTSIIRKGIKRTLWTAKYEGIVIQDEIEEVVEWDSPQERNRKVRNWDTLLIKSFKQTQQQVLAELGLTHVQAFSAKNDPKDLNSEPAGSCPVENLDGLDELE